MVLGGVPYISDGVAVEGVVEIRIWKVVEASTDLFALMFRLDLCNVQPAQDTICNIFYQYRDSYAYRIVQAGML